MAAALLLPVAVAPVRAETAPEKTTLAYKYLDYLDSQADADRISVKAHALMLTAPIKDDWSFSGTLVNDAVSGASPRYYTKRLTKMQDERRGYSAGLTHYMPTGTATVTANYSVESDYVSKSLSATRVWYTDESKNTTLTAGLGTAAEAAAEAGLAAAEAALAAAEAAFSAAEATAIGSSTASSAAFGGQGTLATGRGLPMGRVAWPFCTASMSSCEGY